MSAPAQSLTTPKSDTPEEKKSSKEATTTTPEPKQKQIQMPELKNIVIKTLNTNASQRKIGLEDAVKAVKETTDPLKTLESIKEQSVAISELDTKDPKEASNLMSLINTNFIRIVTAGFSQMTDSDAVAIYNLLAKQKLLVNVRLRLKPSITFTSAGKVKANSNKINPRPAIFEKVDKETIETLVENSNMGVLDATELDPKQFTMLSSTTSGDSRLVLQISDDLNLTAFHLSDTEMNAAFLDKEDKRFDDTLGYTVPYEFLVKLIANYENQKNETKFALRACSQGMPCESLGFLLKGMIEGAVEIRDKKMWVNNKVMPNIFNQMPPKIVDDLMGFLWSQRETVGSNSIVSAETLESSYISNTAQIEKAKTELSKSMSNARVSSILNGVLLSDSGELIPETIDTSGKTLSERNSAGTLTAQEREMLRKAKKENKDRKRNITTIQKATESNVLEIVPLKESKDQQIVMSSNGKEMNKVAYGDQQIITAFQGLTTEMIEAGKNKNLVAAANNLMKSQRNNSRDNTIVEACRSVYKGLSEFDKRQLEMSLIYTYRNFLPDGNTLNRALVKRNESQQRQFATYKNIVMQYFTMVREKTGFYPGWHQLDRALPEVFEEYARQMPDISTTTNAQSNLIFFKKNGLELALLGYLATKVLLSKKEGDTINIGTGQIENITDMKRFKMTDMKAFYMASQHNLCGSVKGDKRQPNVIEKMRRMQYATFVLVRDCLAIAGVTVDQSSEVSTMLRDLRILVQEKKRMLTNTRKEVGVRTVNFRTDNYTKGSYDGDSVINELIDTFNRAQKQYDGGRLNELTYTEEEREKDTEKIAENSDGKGLGNAVQELNI